MATITTHVLDTARGRPAAHVEVTLARQEGASSAPTWSTIAQLRTDDDGRIKGLTPDGISAGTYRLTFQTGAYFTGLGQESFYPEATITFVVHDEGAHFHVPLLVAPFGFSTYRGS